MLVVLALTFPKLSAAQAVAPTDLVGSWALRDSTEFGFTFRADSTMSYVGRSPQGKATVTGRWRLATDTLVVDRVVAKINGRQTNATFARRVIALQKTQLTVTRTDNKQSTVYERVDSLTSPASSAAPAAPKP
jgi:hypothetical protein